MKDLLMLITDLTKDIVAHIFNQSKSAVISIGSATYGSVMYSMKPSFPQSLYEVSIDQALQRSAWFLASIVAIIAITKSISEAVKKHNDKKLKDGQEANN